MIESLNKFIDNKRDEIIGMLETMVNMDTASEYKEGVDLLGDYLAEKFAGLGFEIEKDPQQQYGDHIICKMNGEGPNTLIIGHFDTALPKGTPKERPFRVEGNKGYGPGTADMKSGIVATYYAIKAILDNTDIKPNITVILNSDEEPGSPTSRHVIWREAKHAARCFIMEGGSFGSVTTERKGVGIFTFKCKGKAAHAGAEPEKGRSAIIELGHKIVELSALNDYEKGITVNVGVINGGTYPYVIAEEAAAEVDCRIPTKADGDMLIAKFNEIAANSHVDGVTTEWTGSFHRGPMEKTPETEKLITLVKEVGTELGLTIGELASGGASDGNLTSAMGVPSICGMGPEGYGYHGVDEYVEIESVFERTKLLAQVLYRLESI
jgi:glutamate carboxypeptidase